MVEFLVLLCLIIGIRALYLRVFRGKKESEEFFEKSTNEMSRGIGCFLLVLIGLVLVVVLLVSLAS